MDCCCHMEQGTSFRLHESIDDIMPDTKERSGMPKVTIKDTVYTVAQDSCLGNLLAQQGYIGMPCGGHGRCGKCRVRVEGNTGSLSDREKSLLTAAEINSGIRLACLARVQEDCIVFPEETDSGQIRTEETLPDIKKNPSFDSFGAAVDIGTTTLAAGLYDARGNLLARASGMNPQAGWGADVVSRIEADLAGMGTALTEAVQSAVNGLLEEMTASAGVPGEEIGEIVVTGNTVMLHMFSGSSTEPLSHAPFQAKRLFDESLPAASLGLGQTAPRARVYLPPCVSAFVGADLVTALLASGICEADGTQLLADIGTNGEMALVHKGKLLFCSTAAGPAFEGAGISMGMNGRKGAIDKVSVCGGKLTVHVLGDGTPQGICGSGVVDAIACLLETGVIDETGYMEEEKTLICPPVSITLEDVRKVQLAKGAIHAGIRTLLHIAGLREEDVDSLQIAGGFGSYLNVANAGRIGLIPAELVPRVRVIGNAALTGAAMLLLDKDLRKVCQEYAGCGKVAELSSHAYFAEEYIEGMLFPV